jgi:hypothetical protein
VGVAAFLRAVACPADVVLKIRRVFPEVVKLPRNLAEWSSSPLRRESVREDADSLEVIPQQMFAAVFRDVGERE